MPRDAIFVVQAYIADPAGELIADPPVQCPSASEARQVALRMSLSRTGVVAFRRACDAATGGEETIDILFTAGSLPEPFG